MNTIIRHKILTGAMLFSALLFGASCEDSEGLQVTPEVPYADKTLFEVVSADPQLTDFMEVLNACGEECADSLLNKSRVYTLWAPVNETFNKDSILAEIEAGNRDDVFKTFIMSHLSNHLKAANGELPEANKILLLNDKVAVFSGDYVNGYTFAGCKLVESNIRVWNGILHKLATPAEYRYSVWEYMTVDPRLQGVADFLHSYNVTEFNAGQSILGPFQNGEQTYLDSVFTTSNRLLNSWSGVGELDREDSLYVLYLPTNEAWNEIVAKAEQYYRYDYSVFPKHNQEMDSVYYDSIANYFPRWNVVKYLSFSQYEQKYVKSPDSIMPANREGRERPLFAKSQLEQNVIFTKELSNGVVKIVDSFPYNEFELWHDTIKIEGENEKNRDDQVNTAIKYVTERNMNPDSAFADVKISGSSYVEALSERSAVTLRYKVPNLLSANYNVAFVFVPKHITNATIDPETLLPGSYTITLFNGLKQLSTYTISNDPTKVDTVYLEKNDERAVVSIPNCGYFNKALDNEDVRIVIQIRSKYQNKKFDPSILLDAILFEPVGE